jgi:hypothetical protein
MNVCCGGEGSVGANGGRVPDQCDGEVDLCLRVKVILLENKLANYVVIVAGDDWTGKWGLKGI